jgi:hypothetical protein
VGFTRAFCNWQAPLSLGDVEAKSQGANDMTRTTRTTAEEIQNMGFRKSS